MKEQAVTRNVLPTKNIAIGNNHIILHSAEYTPKEVSHPDGLIVFIPGWSMEGKTRALRHLGRSLAKESGSTVLTISSTFIKPHPNSFDDQVCGIEDEIVKQGARKVILVGYSEGAVKTLKIAANLEQKHLTQPDSPEVEGVVLFSPLGVAEHKHSKLATSLAKAGFFHIPKETIKEIVQHPREWKKFFEAASAATAIFKTMGKRMLRRGPIRYIQHIQQELANMADPIPEAQHLKAPIVIMLGTKDTVIPFTDALQEIYRDLPRAIVMRHERFGHHGMPFQEYKSVARETLGAIRRTNPQLEI